MQMGKIVIIGTKCRGKNLATGFKQGKHETGTKRRKNMQWYQEQENL